MASIRNVSPDARFIGYGVPFNQWVEPEATATVDDDAAEAYTSQPELWQAVPNVSPSAPVVPAPVQEPTE